MPRFVDSHGDEISGRLGLLPDIARQVGCWLSQLKTLEPPPITVFIGSDSAK
jgi:hypothetical protein